MRPISSELVSIQSEIRDAFQWPLDSDQKSAIALRNECNNPSISLELSGTICVVGAAAKPGVVSEFPIIAADGAIGAVKDHSSVILVVSDADGEPYLDQAIDAKIPICLHAHGDNIDQWRSAISRWPKDHPLILTHQTPLEIEGMYNPGGFTDGDRAVCIALALGAENIELIGFSADEVGPWSGTTNQIQKIKKLKWMQRVLSLIDIEV